MTMPARRRAARPVQRAKPEGRSFGGWLLRAVGVLLMLSALALPLAQTPDRPVQTLVARWAPPPSDFVDVNGMVVHLRDEGPRSDPLPLVLLHGTGSSLHTWEGWVRVLKGQHRVISFDLPGFGLTGPFAGNYERDDYSADASVQFTLDLLDKLQLQRVVIAGNSFGGEVAWRTALKAPARVAGLVLVDASGPVFQPQAVPLAFTLARLPVLNRLSEWMLPRALIKQGLVSIYGDPGKITEELVDRNYELALRDGNRRAFRLRVQQLDDDTGAQRIASLKLPTLILWGGNDHLIPPDVGRQFERQIAGSQRVVFSTLGHVPQEEDPVATVVPAKAFLQSLK